MKQLIATWHRLTALVRGQRLERDLDAEVAFHLSMREQELRGAGLSIRPRARKRDSVSATSRT